MGRFARISTGILIHILVLAAIGLWVQSYPGQFHTGRAGPTRHLFLDSRDGFLSIQWMNHPSARKPKVRRFGVEPYFRPDELLIDYGLPHPSSTAFVGFTVWSGNFSRQDPASDWSYRIVYVRWWLITALATALWLCWLVAVVRARHRRRRVMTGHCPRCGYDLRGNPAAGRCPECGNPIPIAPADLA